jgi:hypothetical protein
LSNLLTRITTTITFDKNNSLFKRSKQFNFNQTNFKNDSFSINRINFKQRKWFKIEIQWQLSRCFVGERFSSHQTRQATKTSPNIILNSIDFKINIENKFKRLIFENFKPFINRILIYLWCWTFFKTTKKKIIDTQNKKMTRHKKIFENKPNTIEI